MAGNDDLHPLLRNINKTVGKLREDVQTLVGEVKKIPEVLEQGFTNLRDAIHESIQAQAELKMMERMMEVKTVKPQIEAEQSQIENVQAELDERLENIAERYERKHADLDERAESRVRDLGSHIFAIEEAEFEAGVEDPFTSQVTPVWRTLQAHNAVVSEERESTVLETTSTVVEEIDAFLERKDELVDQIDDHVADPESIPVETTERTEIQLPYYVLEYTIDGVTEQVLVPPSTLRVSEDETSWTAAELEPVHGADDLLSTERRIDESAATREPIARTRVLATLEEYGTSSHLGPSYTDAVEAALPQGVQITIEGGAD